MIVFLVIAIIAGVLHGALGDFADSSSIAIAYAFTGFMCGLVLRTRLVESVLRMLMVSFMMIGFAGAGTLTMLASIGGGSDLLILQGMIWGVAGLGATILFVGQGWQFMLPLIGVVCFGVAGAFGSLLIDTFGSDFIMVTTPVMVCLGAGVFDRICGGLGLESPQQGFARLRVRFQLRRTEYDFNLPSESSPTESQSKSAEPD